VAKTAGFSDAADQTLPVTEFSEIYEFSYVFRKIQLQVTFGLLHLGKSGSFRHYVRGQELSNKQPLNRV
jgi:hypothetical protein